MEKNEVYTAICTGYTEDGLGVTRINGAVIFVPNLIVGEEAEIGITKMKNNDTVLLMTNMEQDGEIQD